MFWSLVLKHLENKVLGKFVLKLNTETLELQH